MSTRNARKSFESAPFEALEPRRLLDATTVADDTYEHNDNPRQVLNLRSPGGANFAAVEGSLVIAGLRSLDTDWYRFRLTTEGNSESQLSINHRNRRGDLDLSLFSARGQQLLAQSATSANRESLSLDGLPAGWYMARISGHNPAYRLALNAPITPDDAPPVELNDSFDLVDTAAVAIPGSPNLGTISGAFSLPNKILNDTYDIYKFTVAATPSPTSAVSISSATPFNLSLFGSSRQSVAFAAGYMGQTSVSLANLAPGEYYVQVTHYVLGLAGSFNYDLTFA